jgi:hypothetical protein
MSTHVANDPDLIPEAALKARWRVHGDTVVRWRNTAAGWPEVAAQIGRRRWYRREDVEAFERRKLVPA